VPEDADTDVATATDTPVVDADGDGDPCAPAPTGLLVWLQGEDTTDTMGTATLEGTVGHVPGVVGQALDLSADPGLRDADPDPWLVSPISIEAWVNTTVVGSSQTILADCECGGGRAPTTAPAPPPMCSASMRRAAPGSPFGTPTPSRASSPTP
jgi:hypothetical protein